MESREVLTMKGKPLTFEQLREMGGQPVYVERNEEPYDGKWFIVDYADTINPDRTLYTREGTTYSDYGIYFTAHDRPPTTINREAWEPCKRCTACAGCVHFLSRDGYEFCKGCIFGQNHKPLTQYCPSCGRPLTEEAWAELEKRLEVKA